MQARKAPVGTSNSLRERKRERGKREGCTIPSWLILKADRKPQALLTQKGASR